MGVVAPFFLLVGNLGVLRVGLSRVLLSLAVGVVKAVVVVGFVLGFRCFPLVCV